MKFISILWLMIISAICVASEVADKKAIAVTPEILELMKEARNMSSREFEEFYRKYSTTIEVIRCPGQEEFAAESLEMCEKMKELME